MTLLCLGCLQCVECDPESWRTEMVLHARLNLDSHPRFLRVQPVKSDFEAIMYATAAVHGPWSEALTS